MNPYDICVISLDPTVGDEQRLAAKLGRLEPRIIKKVKAVIKEMLVDQGSSPRIHNSHRISIKRSIFPRASCDFLAIMEI